MADPGRLPPRLRVALLEPEPIRVQGFVTLFQDHPRIEFVVFELAQFLADQEFKLALIGLHGDKLPLPLVGTIHGLRPDVRLIVMGPEANDEVILQAITSGAKAYLEANATAQQVEQAIEIVSQGSIWAPRRVLSIFVDRATRPSRYPSQGFPMFHKGSYAQPARPVHILEDKGQSGVACRKPRCSAVNLVSCMTNDEIRELIQLATETGVAELEVQRGENRVRIRTKFGVEASVMVPQSVPAAVAPAPPPKADPPAAKETDSLVYVK